MTSLRLSAAVAIRAVESMRRPMFRLKSIIQNLTSTEAAKTPTESQLKGASSG